MVALLTDSFGLKSSKLAQLDSTKFDEEPFEGQKRTKTSILCSRREDIGIGKRKMAFEKNIAHANVPQRCVEQGLVCAMNCSNGAPGQAAASSCGDTEVA